jgi:hypothetical protein
MQLLVILMPLALIAACESLLLTLALRGLPGETSGPMHIARGLKHFTIWGIVGCSLAFSMAPSLLVGRMLFGVARLDMAFPTTMVIVVINLVLWSQVQALSKRGGE